jgi:hypothetical protein
MADSNFIANHITLGNYVNGKEITLLDYRYNISLRMVRIVEDRNDRIVFPLGRAPDLGSFFASLL